VKIEARFWSLTPPPADLARLEAWLDPSERARAAAYRHEVHRHRFIVRRGRLREWLGRLAGCSPAAIRYAIGRHGKPFLPGYPDLCFSLSSAGASALCAVGPVPLGCDLEQNRPVPEATAIAARLFTAAEREALAREEVGSSTFLTFWTRKEAFLKATGQGFSAPPDACDLSGNDTRLEGPGGRTWLTRSVAVPVGHLAAVSVMTDGDFTWALQA